MKSIYNNFIKMAWKAFLSNFNILKLPYKLTFAITYKCNSRCTHCSIWHRSTENELKLKEIQEFAQKTNFFSWFNITGGEPFIRKDFIDIIQALLENSPNTYLINTTTNSIEYDIILKKVEEMLELNIPRMIITLSLDGDEIKNDEIRGVSNSFSNVINLYKRLRYLRKSHKNLNTYLGYTVQPSNLGNFTKTYFSVKKYIPDLKPLDIHVNLFHYSAHFYDNLLVNRNLSGENQNKKFIAQLNDITQIRNKNPVFNPIINLLENQYLKNAKKYLKNGITPMACKALQTSCFLDPSGTVYPCISYDKPIGNLRDSQYDLRRILTSNAISILKKEIMSLECPNCWTPCEAYQMILGNLSSIFKS